jgi:hypothetical protein
MSSSATLAGVPIRDFSIIFLNSSAPCLGGLVRQFDGPEPQLVDRFYLGSHFHQSATT